MVAVRDVSLMLIAIRGLLKQRLAMPMESASKTFLFQPIASPAKSGLALVAISKNLAYAKMRVLDLTVVPRVVVPSKMESGVFSVFQVLNHPLPLLSLPLAKHQLIMIFMM